MQKYSFTISILLFSFFCNSLFGQQSKQNIHINKELAAAISLFDNQKYAAAQKLFISIAENNSDKAIQSDACYYTAICGIRLFNSDAYKLLSQFIETYPESPRIFSAYFEMGNNAFREQKYTDALQWYSKVSINNFSNVDIAEFFYKFAYSYYTQKEFAKAKPLFKEVKSAKSVYSENALFYYSYLEYVDKNYTVALPGFEELADSTIFSTVVPPYICQIYYVYEEYDKLIRYARGIESIVNPQQLPDVYRVLAGAYYKTLQYDQALPYYEKYFKDATNPSKSDYYDLGYLYYRAENYAKAAELFQYVTEEEGTIAQNAYYHLGDCYIKTDKKDKARNAFRAAMNFSQNPEIQEDATFIHAKLIYELSYAPFNEAITAMKGFIQSYPHSKYKDEANALLVKIFLSAKNYRDALSSLESISTLTTDLKMAYQQIAYFRGIELFNNNMYSEALVHFDKALQYGIFDKNIRANTMYWKAEAYYKLEKYANARTLFNEFVLTPGAFSSDEYKRAHYTIGYTYFEEKNYSQAAVWFRKFLDIQNDTKSQYYSDAAIRAGDSYYILKDFNQAIKFYGRAVSSGSYDTEYALFQEAFCQGLVGNQSAKISLLSQFTKRYPSSHYYDDAVFELAEAYIKIGSVDKATEYYQIIIQNYTASSYIKKALLQVAFIIYNSDKLDESFIMYKRVVEQYPGSEEAQTALNMIRNIYRKKSDMNSYFSYIQNLGGYATITEAEQDSLSFDVAQELYLNGDCQRALPLLKNYIQQFGDGYFVIPANYYAAECYYEGGYEFEALQNYLFVLQKKPNQFEESALVRIATIHLNSKQFQDAIPILIELEQKAQRKQNLAFARNGLIQCYVQTNEYERLVATAHTFIQIEKLEDADIRWARLHMAHALDSLKDTTEALLQYRTLAIEYNTAEGSEAQYKVASYLFAQKKHEECEKEIIQFLEKSTPHQYWLGKSYILWAQVFIARNELFQARYTLQNVLEHYKIQTDGILDEVSDWLNFIADKEIEAAKVDEAPIIVPMGENPELFMTE